jgi:phosphotransferase system enzyme I (PtsP)
MSQFVERRRHVMQMKGGDRIAPSEPALRIIMRRLREIMAEPTADGQSRLDKIVRQIAGLMVAEVSSIYLKRQDGSLELFATEGLNPGAVHNTLLKRGEGLVGRCAELAVPINEPDAQNHPAFSYRPETGEEIYHAFLGVPILRGGHTIGVLTVQNRTQRHYSDEEVEALQTTAMVIAEMIASGGLVVTRRQPEARRGERRSTGVHFRRRGARHVVLHEPRILVTAHRRGYRAERRRLAQAIEELTG